MQIEFLVSTLNCDSSLALLNKMNINTNVLIVNQSDKVDYSEKTTSKFVVREIKSDKRGIGLSRGTAFLYSQGEICVLSDDDMIYNDSSVEVIRKAYSDYPDADMIVFNVTVKEKNRERNLVQKNGRVRWYNCLKYGAVSFTFKKESIVKKRINFSQQFGGGEKYSSGEDSLFIWDVIKSGLKVYSVKDNIATVYNDQSTWFKGYDERYFFDRGALFYSLSPKFYLLLMFQFLIRHKKLYSANYSFNQVFKFMMRGVRDIKI